MLEIISKILDLVLTGGKALRENAQLERRREYGQALLTCYLRIIEVLTAGDKIIAELEYYVERCHRYKEEGRNDFDHGTFELQALCNEQGLNLLRLSSSISDVSHEMSVFAPEISSDLSKLVSGKRHAIWKLANTLGTGYVYLGGQPETVSRRDRMHRPRINEMQEMRDSSVFLADDWTFDQLAEIESYIASGAPQERLAEIRMAADELRKLVVSSFSVDDILWSIGSFKSASELHFSEDTARAKSFFEPPSPPLGKGPK